MLDDFRTALAEVDVLVLQEVAEVADDAALDAIFPKSEWLHLFYETECPIMVRRSKLEQVPVAKLPGELGRNQGVEWISPGAHSIQPRRPYTFVVLQAVANPEIKFLVGDTHWTSGTFTNPGQLGDDGLRLELWQQCFDGTQKWMEWWLENGLSQVLGGDLNTPRANLPKFHPSQVDVVNDGGFDKIIVLNAPGGTTITSRSVERHALHSDHDLRVSIMRISL